MGNYAGTDSVQTVQIIKESVFTIHSIPNNTNTQIVPSNVLYEWHVQLSPAYDTQQVQEAELPSAAPVNRRLRLITCD